MLHLNSDLFYKDISSLRWEASGCAINNAWVPQGSILFLLHIIDPPNNVQLELMIILFTKHVAKHLNFVNKVSELCQQIDKMACFRVRIRS